MGSASLNGGGIRFPSQDSLETLLSDISDRPVLTDFIRRKHEQFSAEPELLKIILEFSRKHPLEDCNSIFTEALELMLTKYSRHKNEFKELVEKISRMRLFSKNPGRQQRYRLVLARKAAENIDDPEQAAEFIEYLKTQRFAKRERFRDVFQNIDAVLKEYGGIEKSKAAIALFNYRGNDISDGISICECIEDAGDKERYFAFMREVAHSRQKAWLMEEFKKELDLDELLIDASEFNKEEAASSVLSEFYSLLRKSENVVAGSIIEMIAKTPAKNKSCLKAVRFLLNDVSMSNFAYAQVMYDFSLVPEGADFIISSAMDFFRETSEGSSKREINYLKLYATAAALSRLKNISEPNLQFVKQAYKIIAARSIDAEDYYRAMYWIVEGINQTEVTDPRAFQVLQEYVTRKPNSWMPNLGDIGVALSHVKKYFISDKDRDAIIRRIVIDEDAADMQELYGKKVSISEELDAQTLGKAVARLNRMIKEAESEDDKHKKKEIERKAKLEYAVMLETLKHPEDLRVIDLIEDGAYKAVFKCEDAHEDGKFYAYKVVKINKIAEDHIRRAGLDMGEWLSREAKVISKIVTEDISKYICKIYSKVHEYKGLACFTEEYCPYTLDTYLKMHNKFGNYEYESAINFMIMITKALAACHTHNDKNGKPDPIVHNDLKFKNIMVTEDGEIRITDWGYAGCEGSRWTLAPEVAQRQERLDELIEKYQDAKESPEKETLRAEIHELNYNMQDERSNVFAIGCLAYHMLIGNAPYAPRYSSGRFVEPPKKSLPARKRFRRRIMDTFNSAQANKDILDNLDILPGKYDGLAKIIKKAIELDPNNRYTNAQELLDALSNGGYNLTTEKEYMDYKKRLEDTLTKHGEHELLNETKRWLK